jgi:hypothetical protein
MFGRKGRTTQDAHLEDETHSAKGNSYNFMVVFFAALGSFTYGYNSSIIASVFGLPAFFQYFNIELNGPNTAEGNRIIGGTSFAPKNRLHPSLLVSYSCQWLVRWRWAHRSRLRLLASEHLRSAHRNPDNMRLVCHLGRYTRRFGAHRHVPCWTISQRRRGRHDAGLCANIPI